jgi:hypothetical protein
LDVSRERLRLFGIAHHQEGAGEYDLGGEAGRQLVQHDNLHRVDAQGRDKLRGEAGEEIGLQGEPLHTALEVIVGVEHGSS